MRSSRSKKPGPRGRRRADGSTAVTPDAFAVDATLALNAGTDPRAPGGEITVELCGHWEHDGTCRWPHNTRIDSAVRPAVLRTVVVVRAGERTEIADRIEAALRRDLRWSVVQIATGAIGDGEERELADRLARLLS